MKPVSLPPRVAHKIKLNPSIKSQTIFALGIVCIFGITITESLNLYPQALYLTRGVGKVNPMVVSASTHDRNRMKEEMPASEYQRRLKELSLQLQ